MSICGVVNKWLQPGQRQTVHLSLSNSTSSLTALQNVVKAFQKKIGTQTLRDSLIKIESGDVDVPRDVYVGGISALLEDSGGSLLLR